MTVTEEEGEKSGYAGTEKKRRPNLTSGPSRAHRPPEVGRHFPKQWINNLTNRTYSYNPFTKPWGEGG